MSSLSTATFATASGTISHHVIDGEHSRCGMGPSMHGLEDHPRVAHVTSWIGE